MRCFCILRRITSVTLTWSVAAIVTRSMVCVLGTLVSPAKIAELIEMLFEVGRLVWAHGTMRLMGVHIGATW